MKRARSLRHLCRGGRARDLRLEQESYSSMARIASASASAQSAPPSSHPGHFRAWHTWRAPPATFIDTAGAVAIGLGAVAIAGASHAASSRPLALVTLAACCVTLAPFLLVACLAVGCGLLLTLPVLCTSLCVHVLCLHLPSLLRSGAASLEAAGAWAWAWAAARPGAAIALAGGVLLTSPLLLFLLAVSSGLCLLFLPCALPLAALTVSLRRGGGWAHSGADAGDPFAASAAAGAPSFRSGYNADGGSSLGTDHPSPLPVPPLRQPPPASDTSGEPEPDGEEREWRGRGRPPRKRPAARAGAFDEMRHRRERWGCPAGIGEGAGAGSRAERETALG